MSVYHHWLAGAAIIAALISWRLPRSLLWIASLTASFVVSVTYLNMPKPAEPGLWWPPASGVAAVCDMAVCMVIYAFAKRLWEARLLYSLVLISVAVNLLYTTGILLGWPPVPPHEAYAIILEVINYAALALIFVTGLLSWIGANGHPFSHGFVGWLYSARGALNQGHQPSAALRKKQ